MTSRYDSLGVSASKSDVHQAISNLDKGLYPSAFCKILPDYVGGDLDYCNIIHADTAGTKTSLAYLTWREINSLDVWSNIAQDALVMNVDDLACVGAYDNIIISSTIGRNKSLIPADVLTAIIQANQKFMDTMSDNGINLKYGGGETADVGDIVRTIDVGITAFARIPKQQLVINNIKPGAVIIGLSSSGQASYESGYNSGIGSNGLTAARHDVLSKYYADQYPESFSPHTDQQHVFTGNYRLADQYNFDGKNYPIYELLTSPTRTYLPIIKKVLTHHRSAIQGIIHCSGGAQTKVLKFVKNCRVIKNNLFSIPPVFDLIKSQMKYDEKELYTIYNMGHRMEIYVDEDQAQGIIAISKSFNVDAKIIGRVEYQVGESVELGIDEKIYQYN